MVGEERNEAATPARGVAPSLQGDQEAEFASDTVVVAQDRIRVLEEALAASERERAALQQELDWCRFPEDSPWGHALRLGELDAFDERTLRSTRSFIEEVCPVLLQPGEAAWIATRCRDEDWRVWGDTAVGAAIRFLGPERLLRELPSEQAEILLRDYPEEFGR
jgi:hypothetical protein